MSQSELHCLLVATAAEAIRELHPEMRLTLDIQESPGDPVPSLINGHRPDILGLCTDVPPRLVIADAKTDGDIDNLHTYSQIDAFLMHLEAMQSGIGTFILAVNGQAADKARGFLRLNCRHRVTSRLQVKIYDGLDFWTLTPPGGEPWHLS